MEIFIYVKKWQQIGVMIRFLRIMRMKYLFIRTFFVISYVMPYEEDRPLRGLVLWNACISSIVIEL